MPSRIRANRRSRGCIGPASRSAARRSAPGGSPGRRRRHVELHAVRQLAELVDDEVRLARLARRPGRLRARTSVAACRPGDPAGTPSASRRGSPRRRRRPSRRRRGGWARAPPARVVPKPSASSAARKIDGCGLMVPTRCETTIARRNGSQPCASAKRSMVTASGQFERIASAKPSAASRRQRRGGVGHRRHAVDEGRAIGVDDRIDLFRLHPRGRGEVVPAHRPPAAAPCLAGARARGPPAARCRPRGTRGTSSRNCRSRSSTQAARKPARSVTMPRRPRASAVGRRRRAARVDRPGPACSRSRS